MSLTQSISNDDFWRIHPVYTAYRVSRDGQVESRLKRTGGGTGSGKGSVMVIGDKWKPIKPLILPSGYHAFHLRTGESRKRRKVITYAHRLVLETFVGPCPKGCEARHVKENDKSNNRLENLCWGTRKENCDDMQRHGTRPRGSSHGISKLTEAKVTAIKRRLQSGDKRADLAKEFGVSRATIGNIATGVVWDHVV